MSRRLDGERGPRVAALDARRVHPQRSRVSWGREECVLLRSRCQRTARFQIPSAAVGLRIRSKPMRWGNVLSETRFKDRVGDLRPRQHHLFLKKQQITGEIAIISSSSTAVCVLTERCRSATPWHRDRKSLPQRKAGSPQAFVVPQRSWCLPTAKSRGLKGFTLFAENFRRCFRHDSIAFHPWICQVHR
jgi:hypothetical protein